MFQNKIKYLLVVIVSGFLAVLYNEYFMGILFLTVTVIPFVLFAILSYIYGRLSFGWASDKHVAGKGETIPITIQINNPTIFPVTDICVTINYCNAFTDGFKANKYKQKFYVSVDRRSSTNAVCNLKSEHAGNLIISLSKVRVYDYLKIFSLRKKNLGEIKIAVLPGYYELTGNFLKNNLRKQIDSDYFSVTKSGDDPSEIFAIREYREGDRPQRIHWKLSLKQDQLMIKEFSDPINCSVIIFADMQVPGWDEPLETIDSILECALSLSYSFLLKGQIHYFAWYDSIQGSLRRIRIVTEKDFYEAVDGLLNSNPYMRDMDLATVYFAEYPHDQYTDMFYVTNIITEEKIESFSWAKAVEIQILYVNDADSPETEDDTDSLFGLPISDELARKISETGIGLFSIDTTKIKEDLEGLKIC